MAIDIPGGNMSLSLAVAVIVILDVALIAFLAWMMSHPRHLRPHVSSSEAASRRPTEQPSEVRVIELIS